ncbi:MAG: phosphoribosylformylglycinamidine synthase subunit PurL [Prevotellaceae bacterium]|jgi:phosphoribosylformylglycinamidine synthase|nr:phosphoribosylformylglycinamidine synthase subunit PurL [Prevotellaceae bacterium]
MQAINYDTAKDLGLLPEEFDKIKEILGRLPNFTELSIFSAMWSEHASYKNSIKWLKTLPKKGKHILAEAGEENAGLVDIGDGLACAFKIESHNHPCAVEPVQGAATGVGGINRDIFTMGARPIAQLNSLRFGNPADERTKFLLRGVVKGISHYGNCFGVPVVGGEVYFDECYHVNPLVNAMSVGLVRKGETISATASGAGNPVYIVGSSTGKDGIHGASFASANITEDSANDIPSIQVGDPFMEKLLLEASLELIQSGAVVGMQDMGAAGIICSTSEMSERGGCGMRIDLSKVPMRQQHMEAWEILLSESQERMLVVVKKGEEASVEAIFKKWDLACQIIGEVIEEDKLEFYHEGELKAAVPASVLVLGGGAPQYDREYKEPAYYREYKKYENSKVPQPVDLKQVAMALTANPNIASKRWVYEQYDSMVRTVNMSTNRPSDAGVVNIKGTNKALALCTDCNSRYVKADPEIGAMIAVAESARNVVCSGAEPCAITNCLNFGNPYHPEVYWQFVHAIKGMGRACERFGTPVTGGNVSFYNQSEIKGKTEAINPTPTIGMLGVLADKAHQTTLAFHQKGDMIYLLGVSREDLASSEYLYSYHGIKASPAPWFDLDEEFALQQATLGVIRAGLIQSAHDVSDGGLFITLLESAMPGNLGFDVTTDAEIRTDAFLFGEAQGRIVVSVSPAQETHFLNFMATQSVPVTTLGHVTKGELRIDDVSFGFVNDFKLIYDTALAQLLDGRPQHA